MKIKLIGLAMLIALTITMLSGCGNSRTVQSVDLSRITFDGVSVGSSFEQVDPANYTIKTNVSNQYTYNFEEWSLSVDDGIITEIMASFGLVNISVNGKEGCYSIDDLTDILGERNKSSWFDKEQGLMQVQYFDPENELQCSFVYDKNGKNLVWGIMQEY